MELLLADNGVGIEKEDLKHIVEPVSYTHLPKVLPPLTVMIQHLRIWKSAEIKTFPIAIPHQKSHYICDSVCYNHIDPVSYTHLLPLMII